MINVGNKMQHNSPAPMVPRSTPFIDLRIDSGSMGNFLATTVPLVADVAYGMDDLIAAVNGAHDPGHQGKGAGTAGAGADFQRQREEAPPPGYPESRLGSHADAARSRQLRDRAVGGSECGIVHEGGSVDISHSFEFNPLGGREMFFYYGGHLGAGVGTAAGVKLARPNQQVVCLVGDGSFIFGPTALWNMARLELPVVVVVYNNHAYGGPHNRVLSAVAGGRMVQTGQFVHSYLGKPDMDMSAIAKGFGVAGEKVRTAAELKAALGRSQNATADGKPYLIDVEVARYGVGWTGDPSDSAERERVRHGHRVGDRPRLLARIGLSESCLIQPR